MNSRLWLKQVLRFCIIGSCALIVFVLVGLLLLNGFGFSLMAANIIAFFPSLTVSYLGQALWTFESGNEMTSLLRYLVLGATALVATIFISYAVTETSIPDYFGIFITAVVIPMISFVVQKLWVFQK